MGGVIQNETASRKPGAVQFGVVLLATWSSIGRSSDSDLRRVAV
jgi:hypothetical protein